MHRDRTQVHENVLLLRLVRVGVGIGIGFDSDIDPDPDPGSFLDSSREFSEQLSTAVADPGISAA
jgi:hypothetical protein